MYRVLATPTEPLLSGPTQNSCQAPATTTNTSTPSIHTRYSPKKVGGFTPCHSLSLNHGPNLAQRRHTPPSALSQPVDLTNTPPRNRDCSSFRTKLVWLNVVLSRLWTPSIRKQILCWHGPGLNLMRSRLCAKSTEVCTLRNVSVPR